MEDKFKDNRNSVWIFVFFDLPVGNNKQRSSSNLFRRRLLQNGFVMLQYSIYIRHCCTHAHANMYEGKITSRIPENGRVSVLRIRDKQFGRMRNFWKGMEEKEEMSVKKMSNQLVLF